MPNKTVDKMLKNCKNLVENHLIALLKTFGGEKWRIQKKSSTFTLEKLYPIFYGNIYWKI